MKLSYIKIKGEKKGAVFTAVKKAMEFANWEKFVKGKKVFLKINALSHQVIPGLCTSPWVLEAVLYVMKGKEIYVGDANVATIKQLEKAGESWRYKQICEKYGAKFVNLSNEKTKAIEIKEGLVFKKIDVPEILLEVDSIVTLPVLKTHNVTKMTCALKNQWGCIPRFRHQYHLVAHKCIADVNKALGVSFCIADASVCIEGSGPRTGKPKVMDSIMACGDLVALDSFATELIELNEEVGYIKNAEKLGVGKTEYNLVGDKVETSKFESALAKNHPIVFMELFLRKIPLLEWFLFRTGFFKIPSWFATKYNTFIWYNLKGKKYARELVKKNKLYREEFKDLIK